MWDGLNNAQNSNLKYCVIYNAPYSFLRKIAMQIKHIDNVLTITVRDVEGEKVLNLFVFIFIFFFESNDSAP